MQFPDNDSPFWPLVKLIALCVIFMVGAAVWTKNGWSWEKDFPILIGMILAFGGIQFIQAKMAPPK